MHHSVPRRLQAGDAVDLDRRGAGPGDLRPHLVQERRQVGVDVSEQVVPELEEHWTEQVLNGNLVIWPTIDDIPDSAEAERQYVLSDGIKSHLSLGTSIT